MMSAVVIKAVVFVFGCLWCYEVMGRWRSDVAALREVKDTTQRLVIIGIWLATLVIAIFLVVVGIGLARGLADTMRRGFF